MKLRIAIALEKFNPHVGGAEKYSFGLAQKLRDKGHEVHVLAEEGVEEPGIYFHSLKIARHPRLYHIFAFAKRVKNWFEENSFDITLAAGRALGMDIYQPHGGVHREALEGSHRQAPSQWKRELRRLAKVLTPKQWAFLWLERKQFHSEKTKKYIALSRRVRYHMERHYRVPREKIALVYNGVDTGRFSLEKRGEWQGKNPPGLPQWSPDHFTLLFMGHNFSLKGLSTAIETVGHLKKRFSHLRLLVAGGGKKGPYLSLVRKWRVKKEILFLGPVTCPEYLYAISHALLHPTCYDPCSLVCLEALASGVPLFTTRYNGVSEIMEGGGAVLEDPHRARDFARAIEPFVESDKKWRKISQTAWKVGQKFTVEKNTTQILQVMREVVSEKK